MSTSTKQFTNELVHETSPYLLQHAHNPVNWLPWSNAALEKANKEDKLILISIGYSACHWCHVMEKESFEDELVANIMNDHFVCIKIDREERPDIDQVYMLAVQLMTGQGGWPLNCFALPDGRPVYGGTYFRKEQWKNILLNLADLYKNERNKMLDYAVQLTEGVKLAELVKTNPSKDDFSIDTLHECINQWKQQFDSTEGGPNRAPKFPLPNNYQFLLRYAMMSAENTNKNEVLEHVYHTLNKMAFGGIYDQIGGGFSRYSVDTYWKVPHFEKMLYDNAQLVSLYCEAFQASGTMLYKQIVEDTLTFVERELMSPEGAFYSAQDADSEGEEGKYYVWQKEELQEQLKENFDLFADYFNVNENGYWEHNNYILLRNEDDQTFANKHQLITKQLSETIKNLKQQLLTVREQRIKPGLDNKVITSWNALMLKAYTDAYTTFNNPHYLAVAEKNGSYILKHLSRTDGGLHHIAKQKEGTNNSINGYLEDYCFTVEALISLYQCTFNESYLLKANELMLYSITHFQDKKSGMFYFTSDEDAALISRKMELSDNVIPASNSSIAKSLFLLGHYFDNQEFIQMSKTMLNNVLTELVDYGAGYSNWAMLHLFFTQPFYEIAIVGADALALRKQFEKHYLPNALFAGSTEDSTLPFLKNRFVNSQTLIYVCFNNSCQQPVKSVQEAIKLMN